MGKTTLIIWDKSGDMIKLVIIAQDITEKKTAFENFEKGDINLKRSCPNEIEDHRISMGVMGIVFHLC